MRARSSSGRDVLGFLRPRGRNESQGDTHFPSCQLGQVLGPLRSLEVGAGSVDEGGGMSVGLNNPYPLTSLVLNTLTLPPFPERGV